MATGLADFADYLEQGGEYPDGIPWTRFANVSSGTIVRPATPGAQVQFHQGQFQFSSGGNLSTTEGAVTGIDWEFILNGNLDGPWTGPPCSVTWFRDKEGNKAVAPKVSITLINWYGGPGSPATGGCQPNGIQANSAGGTFSLVWTQNTVAPDPHAPLSLPDGIIFGGGPGFVVKNIELDGFIEFDQAPCPGIVLEQVTAHRISINCPSGDWGGSRWNVSLSNPGLPVLYVAHPQTGLNIGLADGDVVLR